MIEVELKAALRPELLPALQGKLRHLQYEGTVRNQDIYYDTREYDLLRRAAFVRIRNGRLLDFKFNEQALKEHVHSTERSFALPPEPGSIEKISALFAKFLPRWRAGQSIDEMIASNDLIVLARIDNTREAYSNGEVYVSVDHVEGLGDFLEVETLCEEGADTAPAYATLQAFVSGLDIEHIKVGYVELWLRIHNPTVYEIGPYHLA